MSDEILHRSSMVTDVDMKLRLIDVIAVPYDQETDVFWRGEPWREVFDRGAFTGIDDHAGRIRVNREHNRGDTVGKVVAFDPAHPTGLLAHVKIAQTPRGDETLALADEDMISASVSYQVKQPSDVQLNRRTHHRRVMRAFLKHLGMVEDPAYEGAQVLAVRAGSPELTAPETTPLPATPRLDELRDDEAFQWAAARLRDRNS